MAVLLGKLFMSLPMLIDAIKRGVFYLMNLFYSEGSAPALIQNGMSRSSFLKNLSLIIGGSMFGLVLYGSANRYRYQVRNVQIPIRDLPDALKNLNIIHISDIHSGSFTSIADVQAGVDLINQQKPDLILFTGDLVNSETTEMKDYENVFNQLRARYGVYSVFGNHDYGDYRRWDSIEEKVENLEDMKALHKRMGWRLLLNENISLDINGCK
jgi:hypothetical protein